MTRKERSDRLTLDLWRRRCGGVGLEVIHVGGRNVCAYHMVKGYAIKCRAARHTLDEENDKQGAKAVEQYGRIRQTDS